MQCSRPRTSIPSLLKSYAAQVTRLKPSFSRRKPSEKKKLRYSSEHPDADNSNKSSHRDAVANHANPVSSSMRFFTCQSIRYGLDLVKKKRYDLALSQRNNLHDQILFAK